MDRQEKRQFVSEMQARLSGDVRALFLADFRGVTVEQDRKVRRALRDAGVEMRVVKNRLFLRALKDTPFEGVVDDLLQGPNAIMIVDDVVGASKALKEILKEDAISLSVKGGALRETRLSPEQIEEMAALPSREELLVKFAGMLQAPLRDFATMLQAPLRDMAGALQALARERES